MADVFLSYSQADRAAATLVAAALEARGWTVWYDRSLTAGEEYRDEIMRQLGLAGAVVVLWSEASVKSDWVRSEAGRAHALKKLLPIRQAGLDLQTIPPPFDVLHTERIDRIDLIHGAIVAQLAKPPPTPAIGPITRAEVLSSLGILSAVLTMFANLDGVVRMAAWAKWLVSNWSYLIAQIWHALLGWLHIGLKTSTQFQLTMGVAMVAMAFGARFSLSGSPPPLAWRNVVRWNVGAAIAIYLFYSFVLGEIPPFDFRNLSPWSFFILFNGIYVLSLYVGMLHWPWYAAVTAALLGLVVSETFQRAALRVEPTDAGDPVLSLYVGATASILAGITVLSIAPPRQFCVRLWLFVAGVVLLLALNELSKIDLARVALPP